MKTLLMALACCLVHTVTLAQTCDDRTLSTTRIVDRDTRAASAAIEKQVREAGVPADLRAIRQRVLKDEFPRAAVDVVIRRMLRAYCEVVWIDAGLSDATKAARVQAAEQEMTRVVEGPAVLTRTGSRIRSSGRLDGEDLLLAEAGDGKHAAPWWHDTVLAAATTPPDGEEFLRDAPSFVNDSNKYFVIVGSADSQEKAIKRMNQFKKKAPAYDFVVYMPYGRNTAYGIMMATWVSREVATRALKEAKVAVAHDAYLWACRSTGDSC